MPITITIAGESAAQTLDELFGLSRGLCGGGAEVGTCSTAAVAAEAAPAQPAPAPAAAQPEPAKRGRGRPPSKVQEEAAKVADEMDAAEAPAAEPAAASEPEPAATVEAEPVEQVSETDVRATVVDFLKKTDQDTQLGLAIFRKHGGNKLSEVPKENHAALVGELKKCIAAIAGGTTVAALREEYGLKAAE